MPNRHLRAFVTCAIAAVALTLITSFALFVSAESRTDRSGASVPDTASGAVIERGRYLVKITGCNDCHTPRYMAKNGQVPQTRWLTGDRIGWQGPWGTTYPPNLRLLVQGVTPEQWLVLARRPLRPPMPWFALREMKDEDLLAIYHFTRSLGPSGNAAPAYVPPGQPADTPVVRVPAP